MTKESYGRDCKVCLKPFTIFRWCPGEGMRFRRTEICTTCSKLKNICQSCMLDLQYGLPVQVRDTVLRVRETVPKNTANREYYLAANAARLARGDASLLDYDKATDPAAKAILGRLARKEPQYERNLAPTCSFYAKGRCNRGTACPYRHVLVAERYASLQSYRDRYHGENDPAAEKIFSSNPHIIVNQSNMHMNDRKSITSLFVQGIRGGLAKEDIEGFFTAIAPVTSTKLLADNTAALVQFGSKRDAEAAAAQTLGVVDVNGISLRVSWANPGPSSVATERAPANPNKRHKR